MIKLKNDVVRPGNDFGLILAIVVADQVLKEYGVRDCVLTSLNDSKHSRTSLHYADKAVDIRTSNFPSDIEPRTVAAAIKSRLNVHYDVIVELTHIHIEFQPRGY